MFTEAWGRDLAVSDIDATRVQSYCSKRRNLDVVAPAFQEDEAGNRRRGYRAPKPMRDGGLDAELRWLNAVLNWACGFKVDGKFLLTRNPLPADAKKRRALGWPIEKNPRRPIASHQRYLATQEHTDTVDPAGRLRCILAFARYTGRRESAICALRASDILRTTKLVIEAVAQAGLDENLVEHYVHGAIRWRDEEDKQGFLFITPINKQARDALDTYLRVSPRLGDVPLFPAPSSPAESISRDRAAKWLVRAEKLAKQPKLVGGVYHPYRRLWATERKGLPLADVAEAGGWRDTRALQRFYQKSDPAGVFAAVQNGP